MKGNFIDNSSLNRIVVTLVIYYSSLTNFVFESIENKN